MGNGVLGEWVANPSPPDRWSGQHCIYPLMVMHAISEWSQPLSIGGVVTKLGFVSGRYGCRNITDFMCEPFSITMDHLPVDKFDGVLIIGIKRSVFTKTDFLHWSVVTLSTARLRAEVKQRTMSTWSVVTLNGRS